MSNKKGNYCSYCRKKINDPNLLVCPVCGNPYNRQNESLDKDLSLLTALNSEYGVPEEVVSALRSAVNPDYIESLPNVKEQTDETCDISIDNSENNTEANKSVNLEKITSKKTSAKTEKPKIQVNSVKENRLDSINSNEINESDKKVSRSKTAIIIASLLLFFVVTFGFVTGVIRFGSNNNISDKHDTTEVGNIKEINTNSDTLPTDYSSDIVDNSSKEIYFPSFVGENIEAAIDFLDDCDISYIIKEEYSDLLEKGKIISQTPNGDTDIDSGMEVRFEVSKGSHTESMPKSSVSKSDNTSKNSTSNKLNSSSKTSESSNTSTATVSQQTESSNDVIMPNIIGMNYNDAIIILTSNNLNCTYTSVFDDNTPQNTVMTQNPSA